MDGCIFVPQRNGCLQGADTESCWRRRTDGSSPLTEFLRSQTEAARRRELARRGIEWVPEVALEEDWADEDWEDEEDEDADAEE